MPATADPNASTCMLDIEVFNTELQEEEIAKKLKGKYLRLISAESPAKLYCCYAVIAVLIVAVIVLSVALSLSGTKEHSANKSPESGYGTCPRGWIGYGSKCFYYSEDMRNWTFSHASCKEQEALLALFDSMEELDFLNRHKGDFDHWIGLHRESPQHLWMWTNNTEYNNLVPIRGEGPYAYLSNNGISSGRGYPLQKTMVLKPA
ncbi:unknown_gene_11819 [Phodopus roborovskii]|uniref:Unknown_gene_11819 protein n=1 Tax=Phodopus roborovskii TaxID=109678 RepID=A0AAV0ABV3_PHORO|nr:unknown_gene_11819 [Phodopus roborovskii]